MRITLTLTEDSIAQAIAKVKEFKKEIERKTRELIKSMVRDGEKIARRNIADHHFTGLTENSIQGYRSGNHGIIIAGEAAIWLEFGTGVAKNSKSYPKQVNGIVPHGQYGKGKGANPNGWYFSLPEAEAEAYVARYGGKVIHTKSGDTLVHTTGVQATYFMYNTAMELRTTLERRAKEIYGDK